MQFDCKPCPLIGSKELSIKDIDEQPVYLTKNMLKARAKFVSISRRIC